MSRTEVVVAGNRAMRKHPGGPVYRWWMARELGISLPTLRDYVDDYKLSWPPPWPAGE
jgi:hypothetical protein